MTPPDLARVHFDDWRRRVGAGWLTDDPHFQSFVPDAARPTVAAFAERCAGELDRLIRLNNRDEHLPRLEAWDGQGRSIEAVDFHPAYATIGAEVWRTGILARYATPGQETATLSLLYVLAQNGEGGHCCPLACAAGLIKILQGADAPAAWLAGLLDPEYGTALRASQFLTEVQGGSDVGANALVATETAEGWRLSGEKWFCSVIDADLFLVTGRPPGAPSGTAGLRAFVVPRRHAGRINGFRIRRLKYKLGTRSMASAEVDFDGAWGWPVADFRRTVEVVLNTSRLYNAVCAAGTLQRAWREADAYARARRAFGQPILDFPAIARIVARLKVEAAAARASTFHLAELADRIALGEVGLVPAYRMLVNLNKIWTALTCPAGVRDAIEVLGGNGAIEDFSVLPRLLRDSIVIEAWEGGHGVLCAQLLRDSQRGLVAPLFAHLEAVIGDLAPLRERWAGVLARPDADVVFRDLVEELRVPVQAGLLRAQGAPVVWAEHLETVHRRGWDPVADASLAARVAAVNDPDGWGARTGA